MKEDKQIVNIDLAEWNNQKRVITEALKIQLLDNKKDDEDLKSLLGVQLEFCEEEIAGEALRQAIHDVEYTDNVEVYKKRMLERMNQLTGV